MNKFTVFDIDGTLYDSHLGVEFLKEMALLGALRDVSYDQFMRQYQEWRNVTDRTEYYYKWFNVYYDEHLMGVDRAMFEQAGRKIAEHAYPHFYENILAEYTRHKNTGRFMIIISKSPEPAVAEIARLLGANAYWGSGFNFDANGKYIDQIDYQGQNDKAVIIKEMVRSNGLTMQESAAYGDSVGDISMLNLVHDPVAVNPEPLLLKEALHGNWRILQSGSEPAID